MVRTRFGRSAPGGQTANSAGLERPEPACLDRVKTSRGRSVRWWCCSLLGNAVTVIQLIVYKREQTPKRDRAKRPGTPFGMLPRRRGRSSVYLPSGQRFPETAWAKARTHDCNDRDGGFGFLAFRRDDSRGRMVTGSGVRRMTRHHGHRSRIRVDGRLRIRSHFARCCLSSRSTVNRPRAGSLCPRSFAPEEVG